MHWQKLKSLRAGRFARTALVLGVTAGTVGGLLLGAEAAQATLGTNPGHVALVPPTGQVSSTPTWATDVACASGFQGSAVFRAVKADGSTVSISQATNSVATPFSGNLQASLSAIQSLSVIPNGGTQELVVICFSGPSLTGTQDPEMNIALHYSADGATYTTDTNFGGGGGGGGALNTTTTLAAAPDPANVGDTVTLTATETASDNSHPAGSVQFQSGGTAIGGPVAVDANGEATTTTSFAAAGSVNLSAVFAPTDATGFNGSTGTVTETVNSSGGGGGGGTSGSEPLAVTVPASGAGGFTLTVATGTVTLTVSGDSATGSLNPITVADTRNEAPGWSVSGQADDFTGTGTAAGSTISGDQLGWTPTDSSIATGAMLGDPVTPGSPGLGGTAGTLASAHAGNGVGTSVLGADLTLAIPAGTQAGDYTSSLTVTAVTSLP